MGLTEHNLAKAIPVASIELCQALGHKASSYHVSSGELDVGHFEDQGLALRWGIHEPGTGQGLPDGSTP